MSRIVRTPAAEIDLLDLWEHIEEAAGEARANAFVHRIEQKFRLLAEQPGAGRARDELRPGLRSFPVGRYLIFYEQLPDGIAVVRVLHGRRDLDAVFEEDGDAEDGEQ